MLKSSVSRPIVLGGVDGIITSFAVLVSGIHATELNTILGIAGATLLADALSMGVSEYLSVYKEHPEPTETEVIVAISALGITSYQATCLRVAAMQNEDLRRRIVGHDVSASIWDAILSGSLCALSFTIFGSFVILGCALFAGSVAATCAIAAMFLVILGLFRSDREASVVVTIKNVVITVGLGATAGTVAWGVGQAIR